MQWLRGSFSTDSSGQGSQWQYFRQMSILKRCFVSLQLYISEASLGADITTAKSSEVNVMVPGSTPDADLVEHAIPEQYVSQYKGGKYVTLPVSHSGG